MNEQENFDDFSISTLIWNESFRKWVLFPDEDLDAYWINWLTANPDKKVVVDTARKAILSLYIKEPLISDEMVQVETQNILNEIDKREVRPFHKNGLRTIIYNRYWQAGIAAAVIFLVVTSIIIGIWKRQSPTSVTYADLVQSADEKLTEKTNGSDKPQTIVLPDGSKITLEKNSKISFPPSFIHAAKRKVYLSGTAFFEVAKDPAKPFLVYANGLITKVLGTKFWIHSEADKKVSVEVVSGIVSVYSYIDKKVNEEADSKKINALILTANQKANYSSEDKTLMAAIVDKPIIVSGQQTNFQFQDAAIGAVFKSINKGYGIDIVYDEKSFANRTFTATLTTESLYEKMDIICKAINARYEIIDGKIVVYSNDLNE